MSNVNNNSNSSNLDTLPDEILHLILRYSEPPTQCLSLERTCRRFRNVSNEPLLWRHYCQTTFRYWDASHQMARKWKQKPPSAVAWKQLFASRYLTDRETTRVLDDILASQTGRIRKAQEIIEMGYDVKDTLRRHALASEELEDWLARRYFSNAIIACLQRSIAIPVWANLMNSADGTSLERALGAFDLFVPQCEIDSLDEINDMLNAIVEDLAREKPEITESTPREKARIIASYLLSKNYTGIQPGREYHSLEHNFLGFALRDPDHNSLPLISAAIFCYVARKFDLDAQPCGFPFHVHVIISPPVGFDMDGRAQTDDSDSGGPMYMDPFRSEEEVPVDDLNRQLNMFGASTATREAFLGRTSTSEVVLRCSRNILNSLQVSPENVDLVSQRLDADSARYAGLWSSMLSAPQSRLLDARRYLPWFMELFFKEFPWDVSLVEDYILTMFRGSLDYEHIAEGLRVTRTVDEMPKQCRKRGPEHKNVKYRVGDVFLHRRYNYQAIITGWDSECGAGEEWMRRMGIDQLQAGRKQSFYHALVEDRSVRYVAEENIQIIRPSRSELSSHLLSIAGKHFKRWSEEERKFVSNVRDEYPDD